MAGPKQSGLGYGTYYSSQPKSASTKMKRYLIIGIIAAVIFGGAILSYTLMNAGPKNDITLLAVRENSLLTLANASQQSILDPDLSAANSNATILLTSDVASMVSDTGIKKLPDNLVKQEADTNGDALKQAGLLNKFDTTYHQIVLQKISALISEAQTVRTSVSNKTSQAVIDQAITNLQSINQQFTKLSLQ
jgi:PBP1b-binding outer membrane lipoprotein LpoB